MEWLEELIDGIGDVLSDAFAELWEAVSEAMWNIFFGWIYNAIYGAIADFFTVMGDMGAGIFELAWVEATLKLFSMFGWALFVAGLAVAIFDIAIEYQSMGRFNIKQQMMPIIYGFLAVNLFTVVPVRLYTICITLQNTFMKDLAKLFSKNIIVSDGFGGQALISLEVLSKKTSLLSLLFLIALGYCVVKIFFANIKRGGILLTQIAVGSLYMFSIPKGYTDGFISWMKQVIALCLTAFMQMTLLFLGLLTWQEDMLLGLGVMLAANEVPRIAQNFGLDTSMKVNVMSAVHTTTTAINLSRAIARK
jgi:hypothetical protein